MDDIVGETRQGISATSTEAILGYSSVKTIIAIKFSKEMMPDLSTIEDAMYISVQGRPCHGRITDCPLNALPGRLR